MKALFGNNSARFYFWNLEAGLSLPWEPAEGISNARPNLKLEHHVASEIFSVESIEIWNREVFQSEQLYSSESPIDPVPVDLSKRHGISLKLSLPSRRKNIKISAKLFHSKNREITTKISDFGDLALVEAVLDASSFDGVSAPPFSSVDVQAQLQITGVLGSRTQLENIALPTFRLNASEAIWPDHRSPVVEDWHDRLCKSRRPRILIVRGEGGVGKTYFIRELCRLQENEFDSKCSHIMLDENDGVGVFRRILAALLSVRSTVSSKSGNLNDSLITTLLSMIDEDSRAEAGEETLRVGESTETHLLDLHTQISLVSKCISIIATPQIIVISNAHRLSPELVDSMRALFYSIEQFGWSNINFIIEFRNTSDERNVYLESMLEHLEEKLNRGIPNAADT